MYRLDVPDELRQADVAEICGVSEFAVKSWRMKGIGPKYHRSGRVVIYDPRDVQAWLNRRYTDTNKEN